MSGPLATWVAEHSQASWRGRAVLVQYALAAYHDGMPAATVTRDDLTHRTGLGRGTVVQGRNEVVRLGELIELERPGGRGRSGQFYLPVSLCPTEAHCWSCAALAQETVRAADRLGGKTVRGADPSRRRPPGNRPSQAINRPSQALKGPPHGPTTKTDGTPSGGTVTHPESGPPAPPQAAGGPEPGLDDSPTHAWRKVLEVSPPVDPETAEDLEAGRRRAKADLEALIAAERGPPSPNGAQPAPDPEETP